MEPSLLIRLLLLLQVVSGARQLQQDCGPRIKFNPEIHKPVYKIGSELLRFPAFMRTFNITFQDYLTATVGQRFDPPIRFEFVANADVNLIYYDLMESGEIDFSFANPYQAICLEAEFGAQPLLNAIRTTNYGGEKLSLDHFAGIFVTHVDNDDINTVMDLKGKVVSAAKPSSLGGAFVHWHEMQKKGMDYLNDPAVVVFSDTMIATVNGVIDKTYDVGFVRTNFIPQLLERNPNLNVSAIKVVGVRNDDSALDASFPLERSTIIVPEWRLSASPRTPPDVSEAVQAALLAFDEHGRTGMERDACLEINANNTAQCDDLEAVDPMVLCDATVESVMLAASVISTLDYQTFRTPISLNAVRKMALDLGAIQQDPASDSLKCFRPSEFYDQINCRNDLYKLSEEDLLSSCNSTDYVCPEGTTCICKPCFKALPIEVAPSAEYIAGSGCKKMSICSTIKQNEVIEYTVVDNQKKEGGRNLRVKTLEDGIDTEVAIVASPTPHTYSFSLSTPRVGIFILEIYDGEEQIDASPLRVRVEYRDCPADKEADEVGLCQCKESAVDVAGRCIPIWLAIVVCLSPLLVMGAICLYMFVKKKEREANSLWIVKRSELKFNEPTTILGHGTFGHVLQAQYRGSKVAVKRALPPSVGGKESLIFGTPIGSADGKSVPNKESDSTHSVDLETGDSDSKRQLNQRTKGRTSNTRVATQVKTNSRKAKQEFMQEMRILSTLRHPNITTLMGAVIDGNDPMLVMELMEHGSLYEVLQNPTILLEADLILHIVQDIAQGVRFLHSSNPPLIHGDLKSGNVLIDSKFRAKLADFGMVQRRKNVATGTPLWMAPELFNNSYNTTKSDMYSVGVILNEIVSRKEPYHDTDDSLNTILKGIQDPKINRRPEIPSYCPVKVKKLIMFLWHADPKLRPTAAELNNRLEELNDQVFAPCVPKSAASKNRASEALAGDHRDFMYQAFPRHVADLLISGGKVEPEPHNDVSICFSDIVGFTTIASKMEPLKVSNMLDRLYLKFDDITKKHDLFKVETVGDAYMCAGNLAKDQHKDHVRRIAMFATDIVNAASETLIDEDDPSLGYTQIRVGFHSGPVVSNVVGSLNPRYGVFGDTVNIAARIETTSKEGRIQCTEECAKRLMDDAPDLMVKERGPVDIKGRGRLTTFWVSAL